MLVDLVMTTFSTSNAHNVTEQSYIEWYKWISDDEVSDIDRLNKTLIPGPPKNARLAAMYKTKYDIDCTHCI